MSIYISYVYRCISLLSRLNKHQCKYKNISMNIHYPFLLSKNKWKILGARNANTTTPPHHHCRHRMPWQLNQHGGPEPQTLRAMCVVEAEVGLGTRKMGRQQFRVRRADETGDLATKTLHAGMHFVNKP